MALSKPRPPDGDRPVVTGRIGSPVPLRVLVKGASTVNWTSWMGGPRTDFIFPRVVEEQLLLDGRPCEVRTVSLPSEKTSRLLSTWQQEVLGWSPDVIVLVYGHFETIHLFLPRWLERHANSLRALDRTVPQLYRKHLLMPGWMALAKLQAKADTVVDPDVRRSRPRHVAADLRRYIEQVQQVASPLVFCFELLPPTSRYQSWFPGMASRIATMNRTIESLVDDLDLPQVRYFPVVPIARELTGGHVETATPDGFHYSPAMHRAVGTALAGEISAWAESQPHLTIGARSGSDAAASERP